MKARHENVEGRNVYIDKIGYNRLAKSKELRAHIMDIGVQVPVWRAVLQENKCGKDRHVPWSDRQVNRS